MEYATLNNGVKMPKLGFGVFQITKEDCERCVLDAIKVAHRQVDYLDLVLLHQPFSNYYGAYRALQEFK